MISGGKCCSILAGRLNTGVGEGMLMPPPPTLPPLAVALMTDAAATAAGELPNGKGEGGPKEAGVDGA